MDFILEGFDTFLFDPLYATLFPATSYSALKNVANATISSREIPATFRNNFVYEPSSKYLSLTPSSYAYTTSWTRDDIGRQALSLFLITWIFGIVIYFIFASLSYVFIFDKATFNHPKYLKNQVRLEIQQTLRSLPVMAVFTVPFFLAEVRGYSKMYDTTEDGPGLWYNYLQFPLFIAFTDFFIYWIHRAEHHPRLYKHIHKPHHKWIMPTPFASHAFHPMDGYAQSLPYHIFPFIFPLQKFAYVILFVFINIWTVMIHDGEYVADSPIINGAACHTLHHLYFNYNYGQFTTVFDRIFGSYRKPNDELFRKDLKMSSKEWARQSKEMEKMVVEVEGSDDRTYLPEGQAKKLQ
ncbi:hypothetical protein EG328_001446 [Venturia inaequalis]|uniref:Fatty acid hydroxylase domain-containing protein n=1 Tax=Venturia inaequalis TaxID=5025 RepID=A0A8H3UZG3_VENIN|nr:hypothetical protein EG328_001446 [Venturia inaequalis]KAE9992339.1 hypothetical protein EG327_009413 [Venturia inaequalis]RDI86632.1 hypothetical protein Vi05172_g3340 [Venturia inaequalis]